MPQIEVVQTANTQAAPGWAYVYDRAVDPSKLALDAPTTARGKTGRAQRAAASNTVGSNELSRREQLAIQRRLQELERDGGGGGKEVPIPQKWKDFRIGTGGNGTGTWGKAKKMTSAARKILTSEKTFAHYLADEEAKLALAREGQSAPGQGRRSDFGIKRGKRSSIAGKSESEDVDMADVAEAGAEDAAETGIEAGNEPEANNPLFEVSTPVLPSADEIMEMLSQPPLSYNAAKAAPPSVQAPPQRKFCEMCGYWGRVKCMKCGSRVCGLECKETHDQDCRRRFA